MRIETLDLEFQGIPSTLASFLIDSSDGPILVETGPSTTLPVLQRRLADLGIRPQEIRHVLLTHIHLDHAGAAGWWARQGARLYVHPIGAPHLVDPSRLLASATRIYGDRMEALWGEILPAPAGQVQAVQDQEEIRIGEHAFVALDTPGHARHHHAFQLGDIAFTGDAAGIRQPFPPLAQLPAPPPEFDLEAWLTTLSRLRGLNLTSLYPTHFGRLDNVEEHLLELEDLLQQATKFVLRRLRAGDLPEQVVARYREWNRRRAEALGFAADDLATAEQVNPLSMSVTGIIRYWQRRS